MLGCQDRLAEWDTKWSAKIKENEERERVWLEKERERENERVERERERASITEQMEAAKRERDEIRKKVRIFLPLLLCFHFYPKII